jgi:hypothetical protein
MRTEAEITEAIAHLRDAVRAPVALDFPQELAMTHAAIDLLRWVLGDPGSRFQSGVMDPCRNTDRANRQ